MIFLCEFDVHDGTTISTLYVGTHGIRSGPNDDPPNQYYMPRLSSVGRIERSMFGNGDGVSSGTTGGASQVGFGNISVLNGTPYGETELIDHWIGLAFRSLTVKSLVSHTQPYSQAVTRFVGDIEQLVSTNAFEHFDLIIHDRLKDLDKPILVNTYGGTTISGGQGTVDGDVDLTDQVKQKIWGTVHNVAAVAVNHFDLVWQVSDGPVSSIIVYDGGVVLTLQGDVGTLSTLFATNIALGSYITCNSLGLFRLGSPNIGTLTADVVEGATAAARTAAQIARRMVDWFQDSYPDAMVEVTAADVAALDAINPAECGILVTQTESGLSAIMRVLNSIGAWMLPQSDSESIFNLGRLDPPDDDGDPISSYDFEDNLKGNPERVESGDDSKGVPAWKIIVKYDQIATVQQTADLFGLVTENDPVRVQYLALEWRQASVENDGILQVWPNAPTITVETRLLTQAAAAAEAARLFDLYSVQRDIWKITVPMSDDPEDDPGIGELVELTSRAGRMGFGREIGSGELFRVLGRVDDFDDVPTLGLTLYGPPRVVYVAPVIVPPLPDNSIQAVFSGTSSLRVDSTVVTVASDADVNAWETAVVGIGGSVSSTRKGHISNFIVGLKTDNIWSKFDRLLIISGEDNQSGRVCLKSRVAAVVVGSPVFLANYGYTCDAVNYLDLKYNPVVDGVTFSSTSGHLSQWNLTNAAIGYPSLTDFPSNNLQLYPKYTDTLTYGRINEGFSTGYSMGDPRGLLLISRTAPSFQEMFQNGVSIGSNTVAAGAVGNRDLVLYHWTSAAVSVGSGLTPAEQLLFFNRMRTLQTAIGVP